MGLPGGQNHLVEAVAAVNPNVVVVLHNGSPVEVPWIDRVSAILEAYLGGQAGGGAVADLLFGAANPCGKLAESFPIKLSDNPSYLYYLGEGDIAEYREGIFVGYRYYDAKDMGVRFPFGHGLSYTTFAYSNLRLSAASMDDRETLAVTVDVTNTGGMVGKEVVQLYVGPKERDDRVIRAPKQLMGFRKVSLQPGETKTVSFTLEKRAFAYYNTQISDWYVLTGGYQIMVGSSSREIALEAEMMVSSTVKLPVRADINTTVRDILRMDGGRELIAKLTVNSPVYGNMDASPEPGTIEFMLYNMLPDMVIRMVRMLGDRPDLSLEELQAILDEYVND